jgi:hypothetical protein
MSREIAVTHGGAGIHSVEGVGECFPILLSKKSYFKIF